MKKSKFMTGWFVYTFSLTLPFVASGQISKSLSFDVTGFVRQNQIKDGNISEKASLNDYSGQCVQRFRRKVYNTKRD